MLNHEGHHGHTAPDYTESKDVSTLYLKVVQESSWSCHQQIHALGKLLSFHSAVGSTHDDAVRVVVLLQELSGNSVSLEGEFSSGGDDDHTSTCRVQRSQVRRREQGERE